MPVLTLPPSFTNSFWSQDYRRGLETLYGKLEQGVAENLEIFNFIKARALAENDVANSLIAPGPTGIRGTGFDADDGAALYMTFRALQTESMKQGEAHRAAAHELATLVADPFGEWASGHATRIEESRKVLIDGWLKAYEMATGDVDKLKHTYLTKSRKADEAEDDAKFAPGSTTVGDRYTSSPKMSPTRKAAVRTPSVSERISQRLKELRKGGAENDQEYTDVKNPLSPASPVFSAGKSDGGDEHHDEDAPMLTAKDKGKGKEVASSSPMAMSPPTMNPQLPELQHFTPTPNVSIPRVESPMPPLPPSPIILAGLPLSPQAVSQLLSRAVSELPLRKVRFPILGEYTDCFSGEEFVVWLKENVHDFGDSLDRAEDAARELTERDGALRRIGELGNRFENDKEAYFQFRQKAFEFHFVHEAEPLEQQGGLNTTAENFLKRTNTFVSIVQKAVNVATPTTSEPLHIRVRHEAENSDRVYRVAVRKLDRQRLGLEEKIEETLKAMQRWEMDRLRTVKTVLLQYQGTIANLPTALSGSLERTSVLISSYQPENDLTALIERYRTGPFRPKPHVYESVSHDRSDVTFGIDLRKWAGEGGWHAVRAKEDQKEHDDVPSIVSGLLTGITEAYKKLSNDSERRKTWIYDVPLPSVHHLREAINALPPDAPIPSVLLAKYDAPVMASTLKLWALELDPPLGLWEGWEDVRKLYPSVGAVVATEASEQQRIENLQVALLKLPKVHLVVLSTIIQHLRNLIDTTHVDESVEVYITKLGLSFGRAILRPRFETEMSIQDRHPTLLFMDLVKHYADILPKVITQKKRESLERPMPIRKRTKMVDQRLSRSRLSFAADPQQLLAAQHAAQRGPLSRVASPTPVVEPQVKTQPPVASPPPPPVALPPPPPPPPPAAKPQEPEPHLVQEVTYAPPPRPTFVESESSSKEYTPPPRPVFAEPDNESRGAGDGVSAPNLDKIQAPLLSPTSSIPPVDNPDLPLVSRSSLSRSTSGDTGRVRGPRTLRPTGAGKSGSATVGSRPPPGTSLGGPRATHARGASSTSTVPGRPADYAKDYAPKRNVGKANAAIFSRRTVASDAEDNVLDK
ncbi:hypothetical protein K439DRAFT_1653298 [Ramaria rubella]|nr:hypothetical protein K439DRAFT_1653298 [Ramaria rubella]